MKKMEIPVESVFRKVFGEPKYIDDLPSTECTVEAASAKSDAKLNERAFTETVALLGNPLLLYVPDVNKLMRVFWELVGQRHTPTACAGVKSVHFYVEMRTAAPDGQNRLGGGVNIATVMVPWNWYKMFLEDPIMQGGALVFVASQARDYFTERIFDPPIDGKNPTKMRALAAESQYLHHIPSSNWKPNEYQQEVMNEFPKGLASLPPGVWYDFDWTGKVTYGT